LDGEKRALISNTVRIYVTAPLEDHYRVQKNLQLTQVVVRHLGNFPSGGGKVNYYFYKWSQPSEGITRSTLKRIPA